MPDSACARGAICNCKARLGWINNTTWASRFAAVRESVGLACAARDTRVQCYSPDAAVVREYPSAGCCWLGGRTVAG